jgi:hypothetical protein
MGMHGMWDDSLGMHEMWDDGIPMLSSRIPCIPMLASHTPDDAPDKNTYLSDDIAQEKGDRPPNDTCTIQGW